MQVNQLMINVTTEDKERLGAFYKDVVGLTPNTQVGEHAFDIGGATLIFDWHSEVHGKAKEPERVLINFMVDDLVSEQTRLKAQGVEFIREEGREYWGGVISTFLDPDGNYCQLIEFKPE